MTPTGAIISPGSSGNRAAVSQGLVELAVTLPVLLLLLVGLINIGLLITTQLILTQAAWEGARAGATISDPARGDAEIMAAVRSALTGLDPDRVSVEIDPAQNEPPRNQPFPMPRGYPLTVTLGLDFELNVPVRVTVPIRAQATSRMEYQYQ